VVEEPLKMTPPDGVRKRTALWLFLLLNCLFAITSSGRVRVTDEVLPLFQVESLIDRGDTSIPQATKSDLFYGKVDRQSKPRAPYPPLQAILTVPWQLAGRVLARMPGVPAGARDLVCDFVTVLSSATFAALAATLFFLLMRALGLDDKRAITTTLLLALSTPLFTYSAYFFSEPLATALLLFAAWALFRESTSAEIPLRRALAAGIALGLLLWVRPTHVVAAPLFIFCAMASERKRSYRTALVLALLVGVFGAAHLVRNDALFGDPLDFGYPPAAEGGKRLNTFETPLLTGLQGFLVSPGKSVFLFAPLTVLALTGLRKLWRRNRDLGFVCAIVPLAYLLFYSTYTQWEGGYCPGPRYLLPAIVLLCVALGLALGDAGPGIRKVALVLFVAGLLVQGVSMTTSFLEDQAGGAYYDAQWNYRMDYSPLVSQTGLLWKHVTSGQPAPLGLGMDRWCAYLHKAEVNAWLLAMIGSVFVMGTILCGLRLGRELAR
jgi:4-amino-4-deoxy-L-arabinose transferase-like glycosyltransferase